jgi:hypothetical protein
MSEQTPPTEEREPTPEEIKEMRSRMSAYFDDQIPFLTKQAEYEELLTKIDVAQFRRHEVMYRRFQMQQEMTPHKPESNPEERKLKKSE